MPRIFDNIEQHLSEALLKSLSKAYRSDFCVGYFNLRGWKVIDAEIDKFAGEEGKQCRLLVGMSLYDEEELRKALSAAPQNRIDQSEAIRLKKKLAESFKAQLCYGVPSDVDEAGLRRLLKQLKTGKVIVKLFTSHPLHAKLYLAFRDDADNPAIGYVGSSNLTFAGLGKQGELNVDVLDHDSTQKLADWFEDRWTDRFSINITDELITVIEESWAREEAIPPYHVYLKMAYILSQEARTGIAEEVLPEQFETQLFGFQKDAVKVAARHLKARGGVLIGDVVGLGKTITATAVASLFDHLRVLVICPKNLVSMWEDYAHHYGVQMKVLSITQAGKLEKMRRYQLVIIDESHNLRNREGQRYRLVRQYLEENESKVMLLSATPYNKTFDDLGNQLRLFLDPEKDIGVAPEMLIREKGELFLNQKECRPRTLRAFEYSEYPDDWRELMRLYLVRRTRSFIKASHSRFDTSNGRHYLLFADNTRSYFPARVPKTLKFAVDEADADDQYARLYSDNVAKPIGKLALPRYGLSQYENKDTTASRTPDEQEMMENLSRGGKRLMGFCRTGLFKRLESSGNVFIQSLERHVLRNYVFIHAMENGLPLPIGSQDVELLDSRIADDDEGSQCELFGDKEKREPLRTKATFRKRAEEVYNGYRKHAAARFKWIESRHFTDKLTSDLQQDADRLIKVLTKYGDWNPAKDRKFNLLKELLETTHAKEKVLVFTQFADTAVYLAKELNKAGINGVVSVTGDNENPTGFAHRFSPISNGKTITPESELRVLIATDVLSEGQNLQDAHIVVNYDLPWAIIRLIQRAGRVDRIGQKHDVILCYSFLPADGVEKIIRLRSRVQERLTQNAEVVGSDEAFFEDQTDLETLENLYNEKEGVLDGDEDDGEVDLASEAYQIWKNAIDDDPKLAKIIPELPNVIYSARPWEARDGLPEGVLVFMKTGEGNCALAWMDNDGQSVTESQFRIMKAARCEPDTPTLDKAPGHHALTARGVELIIKENRNIHNTTGTLGSRHGIRFRIYELLKNHLDHIEGELFDTAELRKAMQDVYENPLKEKAKAVLGQHLKQKTSAQKVGEVIQTLYEEDELVLGKHAAGTTEPQLICSLGLRKRTISRINHVH
ncbi:MAG: NgoFVII family restriction endonuclease [Spartobacteria bacterium]|nr:NgoFVII family restriction endonuclease [Spartobacteria bacterium]